MDFAFTQINLAWKTNLSFSKTGVWHLPTCKTLPISWNNLDMENFINPVTIAAGALLAFLFTTGKKDDNIETKKVIKNQSMLSLSETSPMNTEFKKNLDSETSPVNINSIKKNNKKNTMISFSETSPVNTELSEMKGGSEELDLSLEVALRRAFKK
jgi:hypothetical protein